MRVPCLPFEARKPVPPTRSRRDAWFMTFRRTGCCCTPSRLKRHSRDCSPPGCSCPIRPGWSRSMPTPTSGCSGSWCRGVTHYGLVCTGGSPQALTPPGRWSLRFFKRAEPRYNHPPVPKIDSCAPRKLSHWYSRWPSCGPVRFWCCFPGCLTGARGARNGKQNGRLTSGCTLRHERDGWPTAEGRPVVTGVEFRRAGRVACWLSRIWSPLHVVPLRA